MGRQQRNRHPANRLGQRRRSYRTENPSPNTHSHEQERAGPDSYQPGEELPTHQRPAGQSSPFQS